MVLSLFLFSFVGPFVYTNWGEIELDESGKVEYATAETTYTVNGVTYYKIKAGDTLSGIAAKFRVTVKQLKAWNGLKSDVIREGKTLRIGI